MGRNILGAPRRPGKRRRGYPRGVPADLLQDAAAAVAGCGPWEPGARVALACSGGADSTFLAHAWEAFAHGRGLRARVLVVDHQQRPESGADADRAAAAAAALGLPAAVLTVEAAGDEASLRRARYAALEAAMAEGGERLLLLGHHADDQAETVLLRILRGTGLRGLAGMAPRRRLASGGELRRPLLAFRAAAIREWLRGEGVPWIEDPSNADPAAAARNRLRAQAVPALADIGAGDPVRGLLRLAEEASDWEAARDDLLRRDLPWSELPSYLRRQAIQDWLRGCGETASPARLRDLEGALRKRGWAGVRAGLELRLEAGRLPAPDAGPDE